MINMELGIIKEGVRLKWILLNMEAEINVEVGRCMYVTEGRNYASRRAPHHFFKSVQSRELGQSPICCTGGARHHVPEAHSVKSIPYPYTQCPRAEWFF